jgi:hypothetical protein
MQEADGGVIAGGYQVKIFVNQALWPTGRIIHGRRSKGWGRRFAWLRVWWNKPQYGRVFSLPVTSVSHIRFRNWTRPMSVKLSMWICYINILYRNYTYVIRKRNLTTYLLFQKFHYMFRPLRAIFRWYFWRFLTLLGYIHHLYKCEAIYCFLICMYTMQRKFLKYTTFYIRITQNAYKSFT